MSKVFKPDEYTLLSSILDCIQVGVFITDGQGRTLFLNKESSKFGKLSQNEVIGKTVQELVEKGYMEETLSAKVIESGKRKKTIQHLGSGRKIFVEGVPIYDNNEIKMVVCTERDITENLALKGILNDHNVKEMKYKEEIEYLRNKNTNLLKDIIVEDEVSKESVRKAIRIAKLDSTVLLTGESGTGKEMYANLIYKNSSRVGKPYIKINITAIPENLLESELFGYEGGAFTDANKKGKMGIFELANHGTLFLDEIGEIPLHLQAKLLRALQEKEIMRVGGQKTIQLDIRIIAATNKDLKKAIVEETFRKDLYYRLNILPIEIMPLRERKKDIEALINYFMASLNVKYKIEKRISWDAIEELKAYGWPGNIRELENIIERLMISFDGDYIMRSQVKVVLGKVCNEESDLQFIKEGSSMEEIMDSYEKYVIEEAMKKYGRASVVAKMLKMNKSTLSRRLRKHNLNLEKSENS